MLARPPAPVAGIGARRGVPGGRVRGDAVTAAAAEADGSLGGAATARVGTPAEPHSIVVDPGNQWILVPHRTPDVIGQWVLDADAGTVTPNAMPQAMAPAGTGPRHIVLDRSGSASRMSSPRALGCALASPRAGSGARNS